jgi:hypothetical protein
VRVARVLGWPEGTTLGRSVVDCGLDVGLVDAPDQRDCHVWVLGWLSLGNLTHSLIYRRIH